MCNQCLRGQPGLQWGEVSGLEQATDKVLERMTGMNKPRKEPITSYLRGFTHSGGAWRIKASPTGRPDKPDQKEHTERRGVHLFFQAHAPSQLLPSLISIPVASALAGLPGLHELWLQEAGQDLPISKLNTSLWYSPDDQ
ncbi:hypothetical protein Q8A73_005980 [Channa argus]|nr:hypothetical protein Q8A73_005980 [Channa argus]